MKELTWEALQSECEPKYKVVFQRADGPFRCERKFHNPVHVRNFVASLGSEYTWSVYKR
jgi:hypothetical protein